MAKAAPFVPLDLFILPGVGYT